MRLIASGIVTLKSCSLDDRQCLLQPDDHGFDARNYCLRVVTIGPYCRN